MYSSIACLKCASDQLRARLGRMRPAFQIKLRVPVCGTRDAECTTTAAELVLMLICGNMWQCNGTKCATPEGMRLGMLQAAGRCMWLSMT